MSVAADEGATFGDDGSETFEGEFRGWYEQLEVSDASVVATYRDGAFAGSPAIVERDLGGGRVVYLAGAATRSTLDHLYRRLAHQRGLTTLELPWGLEVVRLDGTSEGELLVVLNHLARTQRLALDGFRWNDHLSGSAGEGSFELGPYGVAVLEGIRLAPASPTE
jgi:beta-galactosidase